MESPDKLALAVSLWAAVLIHAVRYMWHLVLRTFIVDGAQVV